MTVLYKLSKEQLSKQFHYDFGLRALKSVLVMAGGLKRQYEDMPEDLVLMRCLRDSNMPKFVFEDVPLFSGLINDLFPGIKLCFVLSITYFLLFYLSIIITIFFFFFFGCNRNGLSSRWI